MEKIATRVATLRKRMKLTQRAFAARMDVSRGYLSQVESSVKAPGPDFLRKIDLLERNQFATDLRDGKIATQAGRMTESSPVRKPQSEYSEPSNLAPVPFKKSRKIRVYSMIQAGLATIYETTPESWEDVVDYDGSDKAAFALRVTGDSMLPRFPAGTIIVVSPQYPPSFSDFVAAYVKDEGGLFKVLKNSGEAKTVRLVSLNPEFPPTERPREEFDWIYRVIEARVTNL